MVQRSKNAVFVPNREAMMIFSYIDFQLITSLLAYKNRKEAIVYYAFILILEKTSFRKN